MGAEVPAVDVESWRKRLPPWWPWLRRCVSVEEMEQECRKGNAYACVALTLAESASVLGGAVTADGWVVKLERRYACLYPWPKRLQRRLDFYTRR